MASAPRLRGALAAGILLAAAGAFAGEPQSLRLTFLHTSDLHGQVLPWNARTGGGASGSLARVATLVAQVREAADHPVVVLDSGDTIQGSPFEELLHVRFAEPSPTIEAMNRIGYAAMAVGNHELNFGLEVLRRAEAEAEFPLLAANAVHADTGEPAFPPYRVLELEPGVRVGLLGLITPNVPGWETPEHYRGLEFEPMDAAARRWVAHLRTDEGCDLVVVLAHTGFERDPDTGEELVTDGPEYGWRLAHLEGADLVLTGHTHDDIPPRQLGGAIVAQPGTRGQRVTRVDVTLERDGDGWRLTDWSGENLDTTDVRPEAGLVQAFADRRARVDAALGEPVGEVSAPVSVARCRVEDCAAVDLIHEVQLAASGADLSLASLLSSGTPDLAPGPVTWRWLHALYVYPNTLRVVELTGGQVKDVLEHAARYYDGLDCAETPCRVITDDTILGYNVDTMEGLQYRIDPTAEEGARVVDLRRAGEPLDLHARFKLVCNNYRAAGGGGYPHLSTAPVVWRTSRDVVDLLGADLQARGTWVPVATGNWTVAPRPDGAAAPDDRVVDSAAPDGRIRPDGPAPIRN